MLPTDAAAPVVPLKDREMSSVTAVASEMEGDALYVNKKEAQAALSLGGRTTSISLNRSGRSDMDA